MTDTCKKIIENRKSVRFFSDKQVSDECILNILDCARLAPSAKNRQPWRYLILTDEQKNQVVDMFEKKLIEENSEETGIETVRILKQSSKLVLAFMDYKEIVAQNHWLEPYYFSMGASIENALLRATELGIGSLWIYDICVIKDELVKMFCPDYMFISAICFGYEGKILPRAKKKSLKEILIKN